MTRWGSWDEDPLDLKCIRLDAEMEIQHAGTQCIKEVENPTDPCGLCEGYGFCFKSNSVKLGGKKDDI